ncbi:MAG: electron transport complex subunit E [Oscillospiraceae bacterium]|nr:electron transport complex subunit E [Oscillospiraceae bacterium]
MPKKRITVTQELLKGIIKENPVFVMLLGMCPSLAVTTMAYNGLGLGVATTFVLICSSAAISALSNVIPSTVRLPSYIAVIAGFTTLTELLLKGFVPPLYESLGIFLPLIATNCIIFVRAELFASKNGVTRSVADAVGVGLGFTLALFLMGSIREIFGAGMWMAGTPIAVDFNISAPMTLFILPAGGLFVLGVIIAVVNKITDKKPPQEIGCANCPRAATCPTFNKNLPINEEQLVINIAPQSAD